MLLIVLFERTELRESLWTIIASVRFNTHMYAHVTNKMALMVKPFVADVTYVWTFVRMCSTMNLQVKSLEESLATGLANMIALLQMIPLHMFLCKINYCFYDTYKIRQIISYIYIYQWTYIYL